MEENDLAETDEQCIRKQSQVKRKETARYVRGINKWSLNGSKALQGAYEDGPPKFQLDSSASSASQAIGFKLAL